MKNLLSENMLRFGTKNLSESSTRKLVFESIMQTIKEHGLQHAVRRSLLTEAPIDLLTTKATDVKAATMFFNASFKKQIYNPTYLMSANEYCLITTRDYNPVYQAGTDNAEGIVLSFIIRKYKTDKGFGELYLPVLNSNADGLGQWSYSSMNGGKFTLLTFDQPNIAANPVQGKYSELAAHINYSFSQLDLATIEKMYTAKSTSIKGPGFIANAKKNTMWTEKIKPFLTGNAKAFFASK